MHQKPRHQNVLQIIRVGYETVIVDTKGNEYNIDELLKEEINGEVWDVHQSCVWESLFKKIIGSDHEAIYVYDEKPPPNALRPYIPWDGPFVTPNCLKDHFPLDDIECDTDQEPQETVRMVLPISKWKY